jgi:hypothetical protein
MSSAENLSGRPYLPDLAPVVLYCRPGRTLALGSGNRCA